MADIVLRQMTENDLDRVMEIETASFRSPWPREDLEYEVLHNGAARYFVLETDGGVAAYGGMWFILFECHITSVAVAPEHRRAGYGEKLVTHMLRAAAEMGITCITLEVRQSNLAAQKLYRKLGFKKAGVKEGYYDDTGEDAYIMINPNPELTLYKLDRMQRLGY